MNAPAKKTDRTEIAWAQFKVDARTRRSEPLGLEVIASTEATKLFVGEFMGRLCLFVEHHNDKTGRVPWENVASFGVFE